MIDLTDDMRKVLKNDLTSFPFMMHMINIIKNDAAGHLGTLQGFPVLAFVGAPGTGKTPLALSIIGGKENKLDLYRSRSETMRNLNERNQEYLLLDDIATLMSSSGRDRQGSKLDDAIRMAFDGNGPMLVITAETGAMNSLTESAQLRVIPIYIGDGVNDEDFRSLLLSIQQNRLYDEFTKAIKSIPKTEIVDFCKGILNKMVDFRKVFEKSTTINKRVDCVFYYFFSVLILNHFLKKSGHKELFDTKELDLIVKHYLTLEMPKFHRATQEEKIELALERLLSKDILRVHIPFVRECCVDYLGVGCSEKNHMCLGEKGCSVYDNYYPNTEQVYDPISLVLQHGMDGILIRYPNYLRHLRQPFKACLPPILIIPTYKLTDLINQMLMEMARENASKGEKNRMNFSLTTKQKLLQDLFRMNRCIAVSNGDSGYRYSLKNYIFSLDNDPNQNDNISTISVCIVLLKESEADLISENTKNYNNEHKTRFNFFAASLDVGIRSKTKIPYKLAEFWSSPIFYLSGIGERNYDIK